ncbi:MAG: aldo/keto reductase [Hyphomonadaceae bacterium]|nr:aldo/keto reductase [Hyphomonadaceae bacterium]MBY0565133.1 aldo/keto reductase [Hyphomonadaceae bacterium]
MIDRLIFGCHNLTGGSSFLRSRALIHTALDLGIRRFDVAPSYGLGTAENTLGRLLDKYSEKAKIELTTKFGVTPPRHGALLAWTREPYRLLRNIIPTQTLPSPRVLTPPAAASTDATEVRSSVYLSCQRLGVDCVDAVLLHERVYNPHEAGVQLAALKREGVVRRIGLSGHLANVAEMVSAIPTPEILQISILQQPPPALGQSELRVFNVFSMLAAQCEPATKGKQETSVAEALALISAEFLRNTPNASLIFNTSSARRLMLFVRTLSTLPS